MHQGLSAFLGTFMFGFMIGERLGNKDPMVMSVSFLASVMFFGVSFICGQIKESLRKYEIRS